MCGLIRLRSGWVTLPTWCPSLRIEHPRPALFYAYFLCTNFIQPFRAFRAWVCRATLAQAILKYQKIVIPLSPVGAVIIFRLSCAPSICVQLCERLACLFDLRNNPVLFATARIVRRDHLSQHPFGIYDSAGMVLTFRV